MAEDLPADVRATLTQLFAEGREAVDAGDRKTTREAVTTAETVATNKLPEGPLRDRLLHGCERVRRLLDPDADAPDDPPDPGERPEGATPGGRADAAAAYLAAMEERVADAA